MNSYRIKGIRISDGLASLHVVDPVLTSGIYNARDPGKLSNRRQHMAELDLTQLPKNRNHLVVLFTFFPFKSQRTEGFYYVHDLYLYEMSMFQIKTVNIYAIYSL